MRLMNISARAHPAGNRIDLYWKLPEAPAFPRVHAIRREGDYPTSPTDGVLVIPGLLFDLELHFQDDMDNGTVSNDLKQKFLDHEILLSTATVINIENPNNKWRIVDGAQEYLIRKTASGLSVYNESLSFAIDRNLKGETVYYYTLFPYTGDPPVYDNIDPQNRTAAMATGPYDFAGQMYGLLPAIYHRFDTILARNFTPNMPVEDRQKGQLRRFLDLPGQQLDQLYSFARAALNLHNLDRVDGHLLPLLAQWIGWKTDFSLPVSSQRNELRFAPHLYQRIGLIPTVEATVKRVSGWESRTKEFVHNVARTNQPERLNLWSAVRDSGGNWGSPAFVSVNWVYEGRPAGVRDPDGISFFYHTFRRHGWDIWTKRYVDGQWQASEPIVDRLGIDKHPTAARQGSTLWVFWEAYDETTKKWKINYRKQNAGTWSSILPAPDQIFPDPKEPFPDETSERRLPAATVDNNDRLWLFWLERVGAAWQVKYNRNNGTDWELATPASLPLDGAQDPRVEDDLLVFFVNGQLWLFWARHEPGGPPGQTRWTVAYRIKQNLNLNTAGWSPVRLVPKAAPGDFHDREPSPRLAAGKLELFWSSNRSGNWSVWSNKVDMNGLNWETPLQITNSEYSERAPFVVDMGTDTLLLYRSNQTLEYTSTVYSATRTLDARYAGTTTFDTRNTPKRDLRGKLGDFQTYIYDTGQNRVRTNDNLIARDTIGLYLKPDTTDPEKIEAIISRLNNVLPEFMPVTARAVFITE